MAARQESSRRLREILVVLLVLAALAIALAIRAQHGIEWYGDEANSLALSMRYAAGDHPVVESWESNFSSGMMLAPFVWVLERVRLPDVGLALRFRFLFVALQVLYAFAVWRLVRPLGRPWVAVAIAAIVCVYLPYFYVLLYYNTICFALFTLAALHLLRAYVPSAAEADHHLVWAGILSGFGVVAYPTMILALPFFALGVMLECRQSAAMRAEWQRAVARYALSAIAVLAGFAIVTVVASGITGLAQALPHFANPVDRNFSLHAVIGRFWRTKSVLITAALASAACIVAVTRWRTDRVLVALSVTTITAVVVASALYRLRVPWLSYLDMPQAAALGIGVAVPILAAMRLESPMQGQVLRLMCLPSLGVALSTVPASLEGFETAMMPSVILVIGTFITLSASLAQSAHHGSTVQRGHPMWPERIAGIAVVLSFVFFFYGSTQYVGGDSPTRQLDARINRGPYTGIMTTSANVEQYERYETLLAPLAREKGRIAFVEEFPLGYLLTGRRPGTYSEWTTFASGERWQAYLDITGNYPTTIVATTFIGPNGGVANRPFSPPFGLRDFSKHYRRVKVTDEFVVYRRTR